MGIIACSREVPGRNACDRRHTYRIIIIIIIIIILASLRADNSQIAKYTFKLIYTKIIIIIIIIITAFNN